MLTLSSAMFKTNIYVNIFLSPPTSRYVGITIVIQQLFTFMHLADAFIQSDLQLHSGYTFLLVHLFPGNRTHNLSLSWRNVLPLSHTGKRWYLPIQQRKTNSESVIKCIEALSFFHPQNALLLTVFFGPDAFWSLYVPLSSYIYFRTHGYESLSILHSPNSWKLLRALSFCLPRYVPNGWNIEIAPQKPSDNLLKKHITYYDCWK